METLEEYLKREVRRGNVDLSDCTPAEPLEIAYLYACSAFCTGWNPANGEKLTTDGLIRLGIANVAASRKRIPDFKAHSDSEYVEACRDAVRKILDRYLYRTA